MGYFNKKTVKDVSVNGKRVLLRSDFNVQLDGSGNVANLDNVDESLITIKYLLKNGARVIVCPCVEEPNGAVCSSGQPSLKPIAEYLTKRLGFEVKLLKDVVVEDAKRLCDNLEPGKAIVLENLFFETGEQNNKETFAKGLASLADLFVNDFFSIAHLDYTSTYGVTKFMPSVCGLLMQKEIATISSILEKPKRPFVFIFGESKVLDEFNVINNLIRKIDTLVVSGRIAYTFMNALGYSVGASACEYDKADIAKDIMVKAKEKGVKLIMPLDSVVGFTYSPGTEYKLVSSDSIPEGWSGIDIGPQTEKLFTDIIKNAGTVVLNGSVGAFFEWKNFSNGTKAIVKAMAESRATSLIIGRDVTVFTKKLGYEGKITYTSANGETVLKLIEGVALPGIDAIMDA